MTLRSRILACIPLVYGDELSKDMMELLTLLDRAIMGLEYYAERVDDPHYDVAKRTLADIRKQLDGDGDGN